MGYCSRFRIYRLETGIAIVCILFMTLCYFNIMLLFIMFQVYSSYMVDIVVIDDEFMHMFAKRLAQDAHGLSGRHYVSMVLRYCLPMVHSALWVMW